MNTISVKDPETGQTVIYSEGEVLRYIKESNELKEQLDKSRTETVEAIRSRNSLSYKIHEFFSTRYNMGDEEITISVDEINEFLESIGSDPLPQEWSADVRITVTLNGLTGGSQEDIESQIQDCLSVEWQADGEIWVEDIDVRDVTKTS